MVTTRDDRPQHYTARLEVHLDRATQTKLTHFVTTFRRRQSAVLRQVLEWGLEHGQGWTLDRHRPPGQARRVSLRIEPELRQQVEAAATAAGGDISAWLRHAVQQMTVADFPPSWQATSAEQTRAPQRSHDSRQYGTRFMLRLDETSLGKLDLETAQHDIATDWIAAYKKYFHTDTPVSRARSHRRRAASRPPTARRVAQWEETT